MSALRGFHIDFYPSYTHKSAVTNRLVKKTLVNKVAYDFDIHQNIYLQ